MYLVCRLLLEKKKITLVIKSRVVTIKFKIPIREDTQKIKYVKIVFECTDMAPQFYLVRRSRKKEAHYQHKQHYPEHAAQGDQTVLQAKVVPGRREESC